MKSDDIYKTIASNSEGILFKEKNSKFIGYAFYITNEDDIKSSLEQVKKEHHSARHWCYAYQIGIEETKFRANDDGEPSNSAGMPIYGQIQSFELTNTLVVVVRYFGGVKLGVGGLIKAYRTSALLTLESCKIVEKTINRTFLITFEYKDMNKVLRVIKEKQLDIVNQKLVLDCKILISVRKASANDVFKLFENIYGVSIKKTDEN